MRITVKRGGGAILIPLNAGDQEKTWLDLPSDATPPDVMFDRQWALQLLQSAMEHLRHDYAGAGQEPLFNELRKFVGGSSKEDSYADAAERLGLTEGALRVAICRFRERYRTRLRTQVLETVDSAADADDEIRHLFRVFQ